MEVEVGAARRKREARHTPEPEERAGQCRENPDRVTSNEGQNHNDTRLLTRIPLRYLLRCSSKVP